MPELIIFIMLP